jgi:hypothetical protein
MVAMVKKKTAMPIRLPLYPGTRVPPDFSIYSGSNRATITTAVGKSLKLSGNPASDKVKARSKNCIVTICQEVKRLVQQ